MQKISFFATGKNGSRANCPRGIFHPNPSPNPKAKPNPNHNREGEGVTFFKGNCPDTVKNKSNKQPKRNKKQKNKEKINKTKEAKFYQIKINFSETF